MFSLTSHYRMFQRRSPGGGENWLQILVLRVNAKGPKCPSTVTDANTSLSLLHKPMDTLRKFFRKHNHALCDVKEQATIFTRVTKSLV